MARVDGALPICDGFRAMRQEEFEAKVLELWTGTRIPLTLANLVAYTKVPRAQVQARVSGTCAAGFSIRAVAADTEAVGP